MAFRKRKLVWVIGLVSAVLLVGSAAATTKATNLRGSVGPGATIGLRDEAGTPVTHLDPGPVSLVVEDTADLHDFHLTGPGNVDVSTSVDGIETKTFALTLVDGLYSFICDAHPLTMKGEFTVGNAPPPPVPPPPAGPGVPVALSAPIGATLVLSGGPGAVVSFKTVAGKVVKRLRPGGYTVVARDKSAKRGLRLRGTGVSRVTTAKFVGTKTWKVTLGTGALSYDATPKSVVGHGIVAVGETAG
jgi:hypothetical protein